MEVKIFNEDRIYDELTRKRITKNYSVISFSDSYNDEIDFESLAPGLDYICIHFRDYDYCDFEESELDALFYEVNDLIDFIKTRESKGQDFICQCWEGHSRSAATAAAILEYYLHNGQKIFDDPHYEPNSYLYKKILSKLKSSL